MTDRQVLYTRSHEYVRYYRQADKKLGCSWQPVRRAVSLW